VLSTDKLRRGFEKRNKLGQKSETETKCNKEPKELKSNLVIHLRESHFTLLVRERSNPFLGCVQEK